MVGYLYRAEGRRLLLRTAPVRLHGLPLLGAALPEGEGLRRLDRCARALRRAGCRRVLTESGLAGPELPELLARRDLAPVDPLPLCRAKAPELVLALVERLPFRRRRVALRGENAQAAWSLASALCPQIGTLLLDFDRGEEELACRLRAVYGAAALTLDQGPEPQVSVELSRREGSAGTTLRLWGEPDLAGLELTAGEDPEGPLDGLPLLELLWETGRLDLGGITVRRGE